MEKSKVIIIFTSLRERDKREKLLLLLLLSSPNGILPSIPVRLSGSVFTWNPLWEMPPLQHLERSAQLVVKKLGDR